MVWCPQSSHSHKTERTTVVTRPGGQKTGERNLLQETGALTTKAPPWASPGLNPARSLLCSDVLHTFPRSWELDGYFIIKAEATSTKPVDYIQAAHIFCLAHMIFKKIGASLRKLADFLILKTKISEALATLGPHSCGWTTALLPSEHGSTPAGDTQAHIANVCYLNGPGRHLSFQCTPTRSDSGLSCLITWWVSRMRLIDRMGPKLLNSFFTAATLQVLLNGPA